KKVIFIKADITRPWNFSERTYDLVTFSLVLEHIEDLQDILKKVAVVTHKGSTVYIGELHPFRQYTGSKAKFETENGLQELTTFTHHVSHFLNAAFSAGFSLVQFREFFDEDNPGGTPRILGLLFGKK
ncbi:MAG TPA: class I SAM-dependent methyltransferase, partial [Phnomibacter sp.]|nr:class I SAM-dependent methyltransferase [Phnomibacter sp.]